MSLIGIPKVWGNEILTKDDLNLVIGTIYGDYNGGINDANIAPGANINGSKLLAASVTSVQLAAAAIIDSKIDYTSALILRTGPTQAPSGNGIRVARGTKAAQFAGGVCLLTISFATDSQDGNPNFSVAPMVIATVRRITGGNSYYCFQGVAATTINVRFDCVSSNVGDASAQSVEWIAIGEA